jgi:hypothetical protein
MGNIFEIFSVYKVIFSALLNFWWIIFPPLLYFAFKLLWMDFVIAYSKNSWLKSLQWTILEIIPPRELERGPKPMESVFHGLAGVIETNNAFKDFLVGRLTDRFSLEMVSLGGEVHFYIRTQKKYKNMIEANVYAQYPDAEVIEVEDYMQKFPKVVPNKYWQIWGADMELLKPDPYPIRTYDNFEEDITGTMIDPIASFTEIMGSLPPGQNMCLQFIVTPLEEKWREDEIKIVDELSKKEKAEPKGLFEHLKEVFTHLPGGFVAPIEYPKDTKKEDQPLEFKLTPGEKEILKAVEENLSKNMFRTKMRVIYLGKREGFHMSYVNGFFGALRQFNSLNLNGFKPNNISKTFAYYVSVDKRVNYRRRKIYRRYRDRDPDGVKFVLSTSELATVYHFPDMGVKSPSVSRVGAKTGTAPYNLPVQ